MRLFIALDIDEEIRRRISGFLDGVRNFAPDARWVKPESLHVTLKFLGEQPDESAEKMQRQLSAVTAQPFDIRFHDYGFFPTANSARVFWIGIDSGPALAALASAIDDKMAALGIEKEKRAFSPHLTLARGREGSGAPRRLPKDRVNSVFRRLQEKLSALPKPDFGGMIAREFFLYRSQLSPKGSQYSKLSAFALK